VEHDYDFDLAVVGSGPAGQKASIQAAKLRRRVALIERRRELGGSSVNVGTIPSKTIREAVMYLTGLHQRDVYGQDYRLKDEISIEDLSARTRHVALPRPGDRPSYEGRQTGSARTASRTSPCRRPTPGM